MIRSSQTVKGDDDVLIVFLVTCTTSKTKRLCANRFFQELMRKSFLRRGYAPIRLCANDPDGSCGLQYHQDGDIEYELVVARYAALAKTLTDVKHRIVEAMGQQNMTLLQGFTVMDKAANKGRSLGKVRICIAP